MARKGTRMRKTPTFEWISEYGHQLFSPRMLWPRFSSSGALFPAGTSLAGHGWDILRRRRYVATLARQPAQGRHQLCCQLTQSGLMGEAVVVNTALARVHIQIPAGFQGVKDRARARSRSFQSSSYRTPGRVIPILRL